jgi:starch phosphorylase
MDASATQDYRTDLDRDALKQAFLDNLLYVQGKFPALATAHDYYMALAYTVRDRIMQRWISTAAAYTRQGSRTVCYLSAEFLLGPHLGNNLINLGIHDDVAAAMSELGLDLDELLAQEAEPGLGNGGLGRLAACFLDSLAPAGASAGLRDPLRIRHLPAAHRRRRAAGEYRQVAQLRQSLGTGAPRMGG